MDLPLLFLGIGAVAGFLGLMGGRTIRKHFLRWRRRRQLVEAFGEETGKKLAEGKIWVGMTARQLEAARGRPAEKKEKVFAGKSREDYTRETWSYKAPGESRIALRVYLEDGKVVNIKD